MKTLVFVSATLAASPAFAQYHYGPGSDPLGHAVVGASQALFLVGVSGFLRGFGANIERNAKAMRPKASNP